MNGYDDRRAELRELAFVDESYPYEVDEAGIYLDANGNFILLTASGCSCWDGDDYGEEIYESLNALEQSLLNGDRTYNPSVSGAKQLIEEAKANL